MRVSLTCGCAIQSESESFKSYSFCAGVDSDSESCRLLLSLACCEYRRSRFERRGNSSSASLGGVGGACSRGRRAEFLDFLCDFLHGLENLGLHTGGHDVRSQGSNVWGKTQAGPYLGCCTRVPRSRTRRQTLLVHCRQSCDCTVVRRIPKLQSHDVAARGIIPSIACDGRHHVADLPCLRAEVVPA